MAAAVSGLSPVTITVRMPSRRSSAKRSRMPGLTTSFEVNGAEQPAVGYHQQRVPPLWAILSTSRESTSGIFSAAGR